MEKDLTVGYICDCCGQYCKAYHRKLNSSMAVVLILIHKFGKTGFFHVENWLKEIKRPELRADYHKLRFWGLLEAKTETREDGSNRNGYYKITGRGMIFAEGRLKVPEKVIIYNNKLMGFEGEEIDIKQALGKRFSYNELFKEAKTDKQVSELKQLSLYNA